MSGVWLAIDTASEIASVAAGAPPAVAAVSAIAAARRHAADIITLIDRALAGPAVAVAQLAGIVVSDGPGSFTGLRIGWAAAKGLAQEHDIPLWAVPALLVAAAGGAARRGFGPVAACFDALRGQVFGAVYDLRRDSIATLVPPTLLTIAELAERTAVRPLAVVGDGALRYADDVHAWCGHAPLPLDALPPGAESLLGLLGRSGAVVGRPIDATSEPVYGRPAEAQARWEARHGRALPDPTGRGS